MLLRALSMHCAAVRANVDLQGGFATCRLAASSVTYRAHAWQRESRCARLFTGEQVAFKLVYHSEVAAALLVPRDWCHKVPWICKPVCAYRPQLWQLEVASKDFQHIAAGAWGTSSAASCVRVCWRLLQLDREADAALHHKDLSRSDCHHAKLGRDTQRDCKAERWWRSGMADRTNIS
jgi:hypothetical protein